MHSFLKRFGAAGVVLLVLNEVRGVVVVVLALGALLGGEPDAGAASPATQTACPAATDCAAPGG